jgi:hypothetical protein
MNTSDDLVANLNNMKNNEQHYEVLTTGAPYPDYYINFNQSRDFDGVFKYSYGNFEMAFKQDATLNQIVNWLSSQQRSLGVRQISLYCIFCRGNADPLDAHQWQAPNVSWDPNAEYMGDWGMGGLNKKAKKNRKNRKQKNTKRKGKNGKSTRKSTRKSKRSSKRKY